MKSGRATSTDVALAAGVSQATVSRCFTDGASVSPQVREHVLRVARELGYRRNAVARSLVRGVSSNVAVISGDLANPFYSLALDGMTRKLSKAGIGVLHYVADDGPMVDEALTRVLEQRVDGIIVTAITLESARVEELVASDVPTVLFNRTISDPRLSFVASDSERGGRLAADTLATRQHQRLGYIGGGSYASTEVERFRGFVERLADLGRRPPPRREDGHFTYDGGHAAALALMRHGAPDAIFCANDMMALGAIDAIRTELGLSVPGEVSVLGYGHVPMGAWAAYRLTTIDPGLPQMVDQAVGLLTDLMGGEGQQRHVWVPGELVRRQSVRED